MQETQGLVLKPSENFPLGQGIHSDFVPAYALVPQGIEYSLEGGQGGHGVQPTNLWVISEILAISLGFKHL